MKKLLLIVVITILSGCATTERYNAILDTWMGHDTEELVNSWGYPDNSFVAPNGNKVYVYGYQASTYVPQTNYTTTTYNAVGGTLYGNSTTNSVGGYTVQHNCTTFFEVDESGTLVNWRWKGNACKSY
ncbi:hypothetical protein AB4571_15345 [Vibrio breoganii]|uniref:hypothetical protein n=1 Tax=Vibrio breoganii TaxID=553239 RepID=UPI000C82D24F|nr:hypothetical protein [Vibrio breoganii]PML13834.1 hypothetical protein BCT84_12650 [Vibrio breoganii]